MKSQKKRIVYQLLALFFGCLGVHNFYAGYIGKGVVQLIMSLTCFLTGVVAVWVLIEIFAVKKDAKGLEFS